MHITLQQATFIVLGALTIGSAIMVVSLRNIFHCLLFLALAFLGVAGIYLTLSADFMAAAQVLVYIGAIVVLMMFALMMTHRVMSTNLVQTLGQWWLAPFPIAAGIFFALFRVFIRYPFQPEGATTPAAGPTTGIIGTQLLTRYVLPFELASIVLLVAMVGAIILAKEDKPDDSA